MKRLYFDKESHLLVCSNHNFRRYDGKLQEVEVGDSSNCFYCVQEQKIILNHPHGRAS